MTPNSTRLGRPAGQRMPRGGPLVLLVAASLCLATARGSTPEPEAATVYVLPADGAVVRFFDLPATPWGPGHRGVDLATERGDPVRAPHDGVVAFSGVVVDRTVISIDHPDGLRTSLEPVVDVLEAGTHVRAGDVVARVAELPHCPATSCVHWGVRRDRTYLDPLSLLADAGPVVLLADSVAVVLGESRAQPKHRRRVHLRDP